MTLEELMTLAQDQEALTHDFQALMNRFEAHPYVQHIPPGDERLESLRHSRQVSQEALDMRGEVAVQLRDFNARLEANIRLLTHVLADMDEFLAARQGRKPAGDQSADDPADQG